MNRSALVETLLRSEKTNSLVEIKVINRRKPLIGAVQKVLNQMIILKSASAEHITLTFSDIESVNSAQSASFRNFIQNFIRTLHARLKQVPV
jgi:hypothetical protein